MRIKKLIVTSSLALLTIGLTGCVPYELNFEGKKRPVTEIEDIISDRLEAENPGLDLEITVYDESDDKKKKKNVVKH